MVKKKMYSTCVQKQRKLLAKPGVLYVEITLKIVFNWLRDFLIIEVRYRDFQLSGCYDG